MKYVFYNIIVIRIICFVMHIVYAYLLSIYTEYKRTYHITVTRKVLAAWKNNIEKPRMDIRQDTLRSDLWVFFRLAV